MSGFQRYRAVFNSLVHDLSIPIEKRRDPGRGLSPKESGTVLVHIPKCAGVSLRQTLNLPYHGHRLLCDLPERDLANATLIAFCTRDPFDRIVSTFKYLERLKRARPLMYRVLANPQVTNFTDFVRSIAFERLEAHHFFFRSQYQYLKGIEKYRGKAIHLRFEHLSEDFRRHFGGDLPRLNATERSDGIEIDTPENRERVRLVYRADYELLPNLLAT